MRYVCLAIGLCLVSCGGAASEPAVAPSSTKKTGVASKPSVPEGSLSRDEVVKVVDEGFARFLQRVQLEPSHDPNGFAGFRVVALQPESFWRGVDIRPGDVVQAVNGKSVQWPNEAFEVFESLRVAPELKVLLLRDGEAKQLVFPIVGPPQPKQESATQPG